MYIQYLIFYFLKFHEHYKFTLETKRVFKCFDINLKKK
jgi:hypothetical protein